MVFFKLVYIKILNEGVWNRKKLNDNNLIYNKKFTFKLSRSIFFFIEKRQNNFLCNGDFIDSVVLIKSTNFNVIIAH